MSSTKLDTYAEISLCIGLKHDITLPEVVTSGSVMHLCRMVSNQPFCRCDCSMRRMRWLSDASMLSAIEGLSRRSARKSQMGTMMTLLGSMAVMVAVRGESSSNDSS